MLDDQAPPHGVDPRRVCRVVGAGCAERVQQFSEQDRRRGDAVVADAAAAVAEIQALPGSEDEVEEQVALVEAPLAVARLR